MNHESDNKQLIPVIIGTATCGNDSFFGLNFIKNNGSNASGSVTDTVRDKIKFNENKIGKV